MSASCRFRKTIFSKNSLERSVEAREDLLVAQLDQQDVHGGHRHLEFKYILFHKKPSISHKSNKTFYQQQRLQRYGQPEEGGHGEEGRQAGEHRVLRHRAPAVAGATHAGAGAAWWRCRGGTCCSVRHRRGSLEIISKRNKLILGNKVFQKAVFGAPFQPHLLPFLSLRQFRSTTALAQGRRRGRRCRRGR